MSNELTRRQLIGASAAAFAGAPGILSAQNVSGKVNVGWIGTGTRGMHVMKMMYQV